MSDYISREAAKEAFGNADADVCESYPDGHCDWGFGRSNINDVINGVPAADVEPVRRGRWIVPPPPDAYTYCKVVCSECHKVAGKHKTVYCPNCGAKMVLEDENDEN